MSFHPSDHRGTSRAWLLDLTWGGVEYHLAEASEVYEDDDGNATAYRAGLVVSGEIARAASAGETLIEAPSASLELHLDGLADVPERISAGYPLGAATAVLWLWLEDTSKRVKVLSGRLDQVEYGEADEPVTASLIDDADENAQLFPPPLARMGLETQNPGVPYPWIIGSPGLATDHGGGVISTVPGSSGMVWLRGGYTFLAEIVIAGHPVSAATATIVNGETDYAESLAVEAKTDDYGREMSIIDIHTWAAKDRLVTGSYFISWTGGDGLDLAGGTASGAGDVLRWALRRTDIETEPGSLAALLPTLNAYQIDCVIQASPDARVDLWEWLQAELLPLLPISAVRTAGRVVFVPWRWSASSADAVAHLVEGSNCERLGSVGYAARVEVRNEFRLSYAPDVRSGGFGKLAILTGSQATLDSDSSAVPYGICADSDRAYGTQVWEGSTSIVYDDATAQRIVRDLAHRYATQPRHIGYTVAPDAAAHIDAGDVVSVTDPAIGLDGDLFFVTDKPRSSGEFFGVALREIRART